MTLFSSSVYNLDSGNEIEHKINGVEIRCLQVPFNWKRRKCYLNINGHDTISINNRKDSYCSHAMHGRKMQHRNIRTRPAYFYIYILRQGHSNKLIIFNRHSIYYSVVQGELFITFITIAQQLNDAL